MRMSSCVYENVFMFFYENVFTFYVNVFMFNMFTVNVFMFF